MSGKLNLLSIFKLLENEMYCVVKKSLIFPQYEVGDDIDIFCYSKDKITEIILFGLKDLTTDYQIKLHTTEYQNHLDLILNRKIYFRFDIYQRLPSYQSFFIKEALFSSVIENFEFRMIKVPNQIDEMILRYLEYHEWYAQRPDKIKHIEYVNEYLNEDNRKLFFDKLHYYTKIRPFEYKIVKHSFFRETYKYIQMKFNILRNSIQSYGFNETLKKIIERLK